MKNQKYNNKKVYLDLNIFIDLKDDENGNNIILKSKEHGFKYYYSFGHIYDFLSADENQLKNELKNIERIVDNNYIHYLTHKNKILHQYSYPISNVNTINKSKSKILNNKIYDNLDQYIEKTLHITNSIDRANLIIGINECLKIIKDDNLYKKYRNDLKNRQLHLDKFKKIINENTLKFWNGNLLAIASNIFDLIDTIEKNDDIKDPTRIPFKRITGDFYHCFFAIYCDYFITNDKKFLRKTKFIYDLLNEPIIRNSSKINFIKTKVCNLEKFIEELKKDCNL